MTPTNSDELKPCRDAFEKWYNSNPQKPLKIDDKGFYCNKFTQARWEAWQYAWNTHPDPAPVCDGKVGEAVERAEGQLVLGDQSDLATCFITLIDLKTLITVAKEAQHLKERVKELEKLLLVHKIANEGLSIDLKKTRLRAELAKQPERVTLKKYADDLLTCRQLRKEYVPSGEFIMNHYPNGLIVTEDK